MGAMRVYIAKPWRREVYLQQADFPHPVLAHELAHVVARNAASRFLRRAGQARRTHPRADAGRRHGGRARAASRATSSRRISGPRPRRRPSSHPRSAELLGPRFFSHNQQLGYTLAGSFLRFVLDTRGAAALRKVYFEGDAAARARRALRAARAGVARVPLRGAAARPAPRRWPGSASSGPACSRRFVPTPIERLEGELSAALSAGDLPRAIDKCGEVLAIDPKNTGTRATLAGTLARAGQDARGRRKARRARTAPRARRAHRRTRRNRRRRRGFMTRRVRQGRAQLPPPAERAPVRGGATPAGGEAAGPGSRGPDAESAGRAADRTRSEVPPTRARRCT